MDREASELEDELHALNETPDPELMILSEEQGAQIYNPPPHIAARFYRSAGNRRRSSAASSRRNSMSSSHSHHSHPNRSYRSACQSSLVAQQLRRASILESRKARLADRAAHAEEVRLRAAKAKATPRISNSEEKALAAQEARQRMLAKVAASCAEEVQRAKKIAEEAKEKRATEERRNRQEIEERHAEAERRRQEFRKTPRKPRTTSAVEIDHVKKSMDCQNEKQNTEQAVRRIQRFWKIHHRRKCLTSFLELDLNIGRVREMDFFDATNLLAERSALDRTSAIMQMLQLDTGEKSDETNVRHFLSAFMILGHATDVFSKHGDQEQHLIEKAKELLISFEGILYEMTSSRRCFAPATHIETLSQAYSAYLNALSAWKSEDASVMIDIMIETFVAFDEIWQTVKDDTRGEAAGDYRNAIREQQIVVFSKIKKLAGPERTNSLIKAAIREHRRSKTRQRPTGDVRPRPLETSDSITGSAPSVDVTPDNAAQHIDAQVPNGASRQVDQSELSRIFSDVPPNRVLVHELMMDPDYRIEVSERSSVHNRLNREVCTSMRNAVSQGDGTIWTLAVAENIRTRLLKLLTAGKPMYRLLEEVLDSDHIRTQCINGLFSYDQFFQFMADILPNLCAPIRDEEVKALGETLKKPSDNLDNQIEKLFGLLHMIDLIALDYTNYMVQEAAPTLIREGPGYEQRTFSQDLENNVITLQKTQQWWQRAKSNVANESNPNGSTITRPITSQIYARGLVDLAVGAGELSETDVPETLRLATTRLCRIRSSMQRVVFVGASLLTAKNLLKRDVRSQWKPEAKRVFDAVSGDSGYESPGNQLTMRIVDIIESSKGMPQSSKNHLAGVITRFLREMQTAGPLADPVLKLLMQRLRAHLYARLAASTSAERVRVASTTGEGLAGIGVGEFIGSVSGWADELGRVARVDWSAHGRWYGIVAGEDSQGSANS
ncbi:MAG: hypothetical protein M1831_003370 [Alyxoria varia]|nr:MAG: hypothetical protein M1831_003370 [Alyxoria varia]